MPKGDKSIAHTVVRTHREHGLATSKSKSLIEILALFLMKDRRMDERMNEVLNQGEGE
jgi:type III secretion system FlhB-like substrate exporter